MHSSKVVDLCCVAALKSHPAYRYSVFYFSMFWSFGTVGFNILFGNRVALNPGLGAVRDVASAIISHEQTQSNRVCYFQTLDAVFPKDPLSDHLIQKF